MTVKIRVRAKGPLVVEGLSELELVGPDGAPIDLSGRERVMLCRCGASRTKPICDGAHNRVTFDTE